MTAAVMTLQPRYARLYTEAGVELAERNYRHAVLRWEVPVDRCAVIAIDCWNWHFSVDTLERIEAICCRRIAPLFAACRAAGLQVVHCPADPVASRHPNLLRFRPAGEKPQPEYPGSPAWPPAAFRAKTGEYAGLAKPFEPQAAERNRHRDTGRDFHPLCQPVGNEAVIVDGEDLHRWCAQEGILTLFFVGFNTNACVMMRDYGMPAMARRGYETILLRDCTTGMEIADTSATLACTVGTIASIEQFIGCTMTSAELLDALSHAQQGAC